MIVLDSDVITCNRVGGFTQMVRFQSYKVLSRMQEAQFTMDYLYVLSGTTVHLLCHVLNMSIYRWHVHNREIAGMKYHAAASVLMVCLGSSIYTHVHSRTAQLCLLLCMPKISLHDPA